MFGATNLQTFCLFLSLVSVYDVYEPMIHHHFFTSICHFKDPGKLWNSKQDRTIGEASEAWISWDFSDGRVGWDGRPHVSGDVFSKPFYG